MALANRDDLITLLNGAVVDISVALDSIKRDEQHQQAEGMARAEKLFSDTMIESLPGIVYFYDDQGRFLRWNQNFVTVSGYSGEEIAQMHPLDFFVGDDKRRVQQRITEVFENGESTIEASFVSKDGRVTPYFFTGRRVMVDSAACLVGMGIDITDRKQAGDRLAESEQKYREVVEHVNSIILRWNSDGRITFLNEFGQQFFGYSAEEAIGRPVIGTIVPPIDSSGRDLERLMERIRADPTAFEQNVNENMRRNGERVSIAWTNRIGRDAVGEVADILSVGTDITEQKRAQEALRASEQRFRTTLDSIMEGCQLIGFDWRYLYLNDAAAIQNRRPNEELLGRRMTDTWPGIADSAVFAMLRRCMQERTALHSEIEFVFPGGSKGWFEVRSQPVPEGIFVLSIDISGRKRTEAALRELNDTLELQVGARTAELADARDRAEAADRVKSAFLASMSHELRTPLNSIIGFTGIVLEGMAGPLTQEQTRQLGMVRDSGRHLLDLINDVLDTSKIEANQLTVHLEAFDLRASVEQVIASMSPVAEKKGLGLLVTLPASLSPLVSDERRVRQVILNLVNNAIKFTEHGDISVTVAVSTGEAPLVRIRVADTGVGIGQENLAILFQPFRQIDSGLTRHVEGTGLGLAICRQLSGLLGGTVEVQSQLGVGSVFTVTLPMTPGGVSR